MSVFISINKVLEAAPRRRSGYLKYILTHGRVSGDHLEFPGETFDYAMRNYRLPLLGDLVDRLIRKVLPGVKKCGGCQQRQYWLNSLWPALQYPIARRLAAPVRKRRVIVKIKDVATTDTP